MALELYIDLPVSLGGSPTAPQFKRADLYPNEGVVLKRQILNETGLELENRQFTRDFNIPATPTNNELLGHWELKSNQTIPNPNVAIPARITIDDVFNFYGSIELLSVTWVKRNPESYRLVFYSDTSNLAQKLSGTLLSDIDWSPFSFVWSQANVVASWEQTTTNYYVPVISWKRPFKIYQTGTGEDDIGEAATGVRLDELRVGLRLKEMIKTIGEHFELTFNFNTRLETFLEEAFVIPSKFEDQSLVISQSYYDVEVALLSPPLDVTTEVTIPYDTVYKDDSGSWNATTFRYTAPFTGDYDFSVIVIKESGSGNITYTVRIIGDTEGTVAIETDTTGDVLTLNFSNVPLVTGQTYYFTCESIGKASEITSNMLTLDVPISIIGQTYDPADNMPVILVTDFLREFGYAFNSFTIQTGPDEFLITDTISTYLENEDTLDLEKYVDETSLTYKKITVNNLINFKHKDGEDIANEFFTDTAGRNYGELFFLPEVDFSDGPLERTSQFNIFPPAYMDYWDTDGFVGNTDLWHHQQIDESTPPKSVLASFLLMYRNGTATTSTESQWYLQETDTIFTLQTTWGRYSQVQDVTSTVDSNTLTYSLENPFIGVPAENTITNVFWTLWLFQLYARTAYTLTITFPVNFGVYLKISAYSVIYLNGFYHLLASWDYHSSTGMLTLELLRTSKPSNISSVENNGIMRLIGT